MPAIFLSHGAPPLVDSAQWVDELSRWSTDLPRPTAILVISAHWESAPLTIGATATGTPLVYDFGGFPRRFYEVTYRSPGAPDLARQVAALMPERRTGSPPARPRSRPRCVRAAHRHVSRRGHPGAADVDAHPRSVRLLELGRRLRPLREQGVLIVGSGFHDARSSVPARSVARRRGARMVGGIRRVGGGEAGGRGRRRVDRLPCPGPGMPYAHPTIEHFAPLFVTLGASSDPEQSADQVIDGFWMGLAKRSFQVV